MIEYSHDTNWPTKTRFHITGIPKAVKRPVNSFGLVTAMQFLHSSLGKIIIIIIDIPISIVNNPNTTSALYTAKRSTLNRTRNKHAW